MFMLDAGYAVLVFDFGIPLGKSTGFKGASTSSGGGRPLGGRLSPYVTRYRSSSRPRVGDTAATSDPRPSR